MSGQISVLVYGDCPQLQDCEVELDVTPLQLSESKTSFEQKVRGFELAILVADDNPKAALQCVRFLRQVAPSCATLLIARADQLQWVDEALEEGLTDFLVRTEPEEQWIELLNHRIEQTVRNSHLKRRFHESERRFWTFFDQAPIGLTIMSLSGQCDHANRAFCDIVGLSLEELRSRKIADLLDDDDAEIWSALRQELCDGERDFVRLEKKFIRHDGQQRWANFAVVAMCDPRGRPAYLLGMITDKTGTKRIQQNLEHADKMQAMGRLAGGVAHDFNNLLTIVDSHCFIMRDNLDDPDQLSWSVERIMTATSRGSKLTRQLLTFGRHQAAEAEPVDPNERLENMRVVLDSLFGKTVRVHLALGEELRQINANPSEFEQVIMNLALNARDALDDGGRFTIRTYNMDVEVPSSAVPAELPHGQYTVLEVSDTGCGMTAEVQRQIFEPFFTTKEIGEGTGLGLSTVYGVVNQNDGLITVDSEVDRGTTFTIYFPSTKQVSDTPPKLRRARRGTPTDGSETILLVEDEGELREPLRRLLISKGYEVIEASNAEEALAVSRDYGGTIDLLLTDVIMPGIDGVSLADTITGDRPETAVILMSGYTADALAVGDEGAVQRKMLQKPFGMDILSRTIRHMLKPA